MNPQFNRETLAHTLGENGIEYVFLGSELGGRSDDSSCYDGNRIRYDWLARKQGFRSGLQRVQEGAEKYRFSLLCAEKDPLECHRAILVARHLVHLGLEVHHLHPNGSVETHEQAINRLLDRLELPTHDLFRSHQDMIEDAYRAQERRIAHTRDDCEAPSNLPAAPA